jgi:hypothetical protein
MFSRTLREILERDLPNPNPKLRSRPAVGVQVLTHFKPENGAWTPGVRFTIPRRAKAMIYG